MSEDREITEILKSLPLRIGDVVEVWSKRSPDQVAIVDAGGSWNYRQLEEIIEQAKVWLKNLEVRPGDRVMIVGENCRAFIALMFAISSIDAWPVLVNARLSAAEVDQIRDHCGARRVLYASVSFHAMQHGRRHAARIEELSEIGTIGISPLNESVRPEILESDVASRVAALIYTSGTTGQCKGVMLTHKNLLFVAAGSAKIRALTPDDRMCGVLPISHVVGLSVVLLGTLLSGATLYLLPRFDPVVVLAALQRDCLTVMLGVPSMFALLLEYAKFKGIKSLHFPGLRIISSSGSPLSFGLKSEVESLFGLILHNGYGLTECSPTIAQTRVERPCSDTCVGQLFPGVQLKLMGADQEPVQDGEGGEIWVRGPNVMKGYYRAVEETAAAIDKDGWFNTHDLGRWRNGNLFIVGRARDVILRFGLNVYPAEVEAVLNAHSGVARSAVLGRSVDGIAGYEEVVAFVQPLPGVQVTEAELAKYVAQHLAPHKRPSEVFIIDMIPVTPSGKIVKGELAKMADLGVEAASLV
jgi:long-chain acyl-CoA synthetase